MEGVWVSEGGTSQRPFCLMPFCDYAYHLR